jgi:hypothetical protein
MVTRTPASRLVGETLAAGLERADVALTLVDSPLTDGMSRNRAEVGQRPDAETKFHEGA